MGAMGATKTGTAFGGSVISVPPCPSEVALKSANEYCPSRVRVSTFAPLVTVSVPLAPEVSWDQESLVVPLAKARPRRSISSPSWKPEIVPSPCRRSTRSRAIGLPATSSQARRSRATRRPHTPDRW